MKGNQEMVSDSSIWASMSETVRAEIVRLSV